MRMVVGRSAELLWGGRARSSPRSYTLFGFIARCVGDLVSYLAHARAVFCILLCLKVTLVSAATPHQGTLQLSEALCSWRGACQDSDI